jgi:hypothetical protein
MEVIKVYNEAENRSILRDIYWRCDGDEFDLIFRYCDVYTHINCDLCEDSIDVAPYFTIDGERERNDDSFDICIDCMIKLLPALHDIICSGTQCQIESRVTTRHRNPDYIPVYDWFTDETWKSPINRQVLIDKLWDKYYDVEITDCELAIVQPHGPGCTICMHDYSVLVKVDMERPDMPGKKVYICPVCINRLPYPEEDE